MAQAKKAAPAVNNTPGSKYAVVRNVTLPTLKIEIERPVHITVRDAMHLGSEQKKSKDGKAAQMERATVCSVVDLDTGEVKTMICSAVIKSIFDTDYPGDAYVGKSFRLVKHAKKEGKNYFNFSVDEIDPTQPA